MNIYLLNQQLLFDILIKKYKNNIYYYKKLTSEMIISKRFM